jgi:hypothetical protein
VILSLHEINVSTMQNLGRTILVVTLTLASSLSPGLYGQAQDGSLKASIANIERAAFWKARGYDFNPNKLSAQQMDMKVEALNPLVYQSEVADRADGPKDDAPAQTDKAAPALTRDQIKAAATRVISESDQRALLYGRGLEGIRSLAVKVNLTEASFQKPALWTSEGISEALIKREIEMALESAGIEVVASINPGSSGLRVSASSIDTAYGSYEINVDMRLLDRVTISRSGVTTLAITWKHSLSGYLDERHDASDSHLKYLDNPRQLIRRGVNSFVNDWLAANAEKTSDKTGNAGEGSTGRDYVIPEQALLDMAILISLDRQMMNSASAKGGQAVVSMGQSILQPALAQYLAKLGISPEKMKLRHSHLLQAGGSQKPYTSRFGYIDLPPMSLIDYVREYSQWLQDPNAPGTSAPQNPQ